MDTTPGNLARFTRHAPFPMEGLVIEHAPFPTVIAYPITVAKDSALGRCAAPTDLAPSALSQPATKPFQDSTLALHPFPMAPFPSRVNQPRIIPVGTPSTPAPWVSSVKYPAR